MQGSLEGRLADVRYRGHTTHVTVGCRTIAVWLQFIVALEKWQPKRKVAKAYLDAVSKNLTSILPMIGIRNLFWIHLIDIKGTIAMGPIIAITFLNAGK